MHGLGNDFVVIDVVTQRLLLNRAQLQRLACRNYGIGCDQILLVEPPKHPGHDFHYRIFNQDGSEVSQCGNGARAVARFIIDNQLSDKDKIVLGTENGSLNCHLLDNEQVKVQLGKPNFKPAQIPFKTPMPADSYKIKTKDNSITAAVLSVGNPHCVLQVHNLEAAPVATLGAELANNPRFPEGANISFMKILDRQNISLRVYERGVGETLACGSAAAAASVAGIKQNLLETQVNVELPGGKLAINWPATDQEVQITGPVVTTFQGRFRV